MKILLILAHPDPGSFNHAIAQVVQETLRAMGHEVVYHDLYAEKFDPILLAKEIPEAGQVPALIQLYCDELTQAEGLVIVHPNWWGQPPAILKGWIDRVIRPGIAYHFLEGDGGEGVPEGLLKIKQALIFNTSNTAAVRERKLFGDPLQRIWVKCILELCGVRQVHRRMFETMVTSTAEKRHEWLMEVKELVAKVYT